MLTRGGICVPPTVTHLPYRVSSSTLTAVGRFQLLARWSGTHSRILSGIHRAAQTVLGVYLKRTCSRVTSASSALGVLDDYALYKSTHSLTHYLPAPGPHQPANPPQRHAAAEWADKSQGSMAKHLTCDRLLHYKITRIIQFAGENIFEMDEYLA